MFPKLKTMTQASGHQTWKSRKMTITACHIILLVCIIYNVTIIWETKRSQEQGLTQSDSAL